VPILSADALDSDPLGCELLKAILRPDAVVAHPALGDSAPRRNSGSRGRRVTSPVACAAIGEAPSGREQGRRAGTGTGGMADLPSERFATPA
jgi:hypothetical protein